MISPPQVAERLAAIRDRLDSVGRRDIRIVGVTKGFPGSVVSAALDAGLNDIGESYAQEVEAKSSAYAGANLHFIGRIQRNKVRRIADRVDLWHSVSRPEIVREIAKRSPGARILVQVNTGGDGSKDGVPPSEVETMLGVAADAGLSAVGLMTIGVLGDPAASRRAFAIVRALADDHGLAECSMGMSDDHLDAAAAGSTMLRLGTSLFGPRPA